MPKSGDLPADCAFLRAQRGIRPFFGGKNAEKTCNMHGLFALPFLQSGSADSIRVLVQPPADYTSFGALILRKIGKKL